MYLALAAFSLAMLGSMTYVMFTGLVVSNEHLPNVRAAGKVKLDTTLAHLWFEELQSGDQLESAEDVWQLLDNARYYALAMLQGARDGDGAIVPIDDPALRERIAEVVTALDEFRAITRERQTSTHSAVPGSRIDQKYDAVFDRLIALVDGVEERLHEVIQRETTFIRRAQLSAMGGAALLALLLGLTFTRYRSERIQAERALELQVRAEEAAREHLGKLAHVARSTTMNELAAGIAHEVNQPLAAISAAAAACRRMATSDQAGSEEHLQAMELISAEAQRASDVIRRLRRFVAKGDVHYQCTDLNELVTNVVKLSKFDPHMRNANLQLELSRDLPQVEADVVQIQQVLLNLVHNAVEATLVSERADQPIVIRTGMRGNNEIEVAVIDQGIGMGPSGQSDPFMPFTTTKESGMGMGLSISESIITAHGGQIGFLQNEASPGTTFYFTLPVTAEANTS